MSTFSPADDKIKKISELALNLASKQGASYADIRFVKIKNQNISAKERRIENLSDNESFGFGIRLIKNGSWGFASNSDVSEATIVNAINNALELATANNRLQPDKVNLAKTQGYNSNWITPITKDPFSVSVKDKLDKLLWFNDLALKAGAQYVDSFIWSVNEEKFFASTEGSNIYQNLFRIWSEVNPIVVDSKSGRFESRKTLSQPIGKGYEYIDSYPWETDINEAVNNAKHKLTAKSLVSGKKDLIIHPTNLWLTIHESCGHPSELDRALGLEANFAGTSFLTPDKLGKLQYGSTLINLYGDKTQEFGLSTCGFDDDGVKTVEFDIIKEGIFVGYQNNRELAAKFGTYSNATCYADSWGTFPMQRMPNVSLKPGNKPLSLANLISDTEDGLLVIGDNSWSIDQQRYNFQFTAQEFWEIKNGKVTELVRDIAYQGNTVDFWNSCDAICDKSEYLLGGSFFCGKGEPCQAAPVSHGSSPARFRKINIISTKESHAT